MTTPTVVASSRDVLLGLRAGARIRPAPRSPAPARTPRGARGAVARASFGRFARARASALAASAARSPGGDRRPLSRAAVDAEANAEADAEASSPPSSSSSSSAIVAHPPPPSSPASSWSSFARSFAFFASVLAAVSLAALVFPDASWAAAKKASADAGSSFVARAADFVLHLDKNLVHVFTKYGVWAYGMLFAIIFCETGLVIAPFLPGDSLLFATGALGAAGVLNFQFTLGLLFVAAVLGDTVNYGVGSWIGNSVIANHPKVFKREYIDKTRDFYSQYGGKTVVLARFFVIVRTFAPFVAGVARMEYAKFLGYNVLGAGVWVASFMFLGFFFGQIPAVQENFATTIAGIVVLSLVPVLAEIVQHGRANKVAAAEKETTRDEKNTEGGGGEERVAAS